ncbi:N-acyl amino acid synthase FeeM domain-containing protein [Paenibacillus sp. sgz302251]|jgi:N-acyl-L-homoserine lactone synthetase|uniref:N-acyl amino acid synthase FeeM domain-containing protein n=1 Tax=Paenibacillus sp. sgz302251 TaxID=3414493 RepID=UPI003C7B9897
MKSQMNYVYKVANGNMREKAVKLHHQRYEEVGFFNKNEVDPYEETSEYFIAQTELLDQVVGLTRLILNQPQELPTIRYFNIYDIERARIKLIEPSKIAEISAFTKMQAHDVGLGLIKSAIEYSYQQGLTHWVCCIDERVYNYMLRMFKFPFKVIGEPKVYLGSTSIPCLLDIGECLSTLKELRPSLYEYFVSFELPSVEVSL